MDTEHLIKALGADRSTHRAGLRASFTVALVLAVLLAAAAFLVLIGPRADIAVAAGTPRFLLKFVETLALAGSAFGLAMALATPGAPPGRRALWLLAAPLILAVAVVVELLVTPDTQWAARMIGTNISVCLTMIPLIGVGPLVIMLTAMSHAAPTRPALAGAVAGLVAGGLAATFYAAHCTDDSPLFVAVWYSVAIGMLAIAGAVAGSRVLRW